MADCEENPDNGIRIILPKKGFYFTEHNADFVLCKPKLMPLKSITLDKLETLQREAQEQLKEEEKSEREQSSNGSTYSRPLVNLDLHNGQGYD